MKPTPPKSLRKHLQVLVFQDGLTSRSFEIPLKWLTHLGWYLGGCALVTILAVAGVIHLWRSSHRAQPERLRELEQQIRLLGESNKVLESKATSASSLQPVACTAAAPLTATPTPSASVTTPSATALPAPCPVVAPVPPAPAPVVATATHSPGRTPPATHAGVGYQALPAGIEGEVPLIARPSIPLELGSPLIRWKGRKLQLQFDIRFTGEEGQNQQGKILVIARGPETILGYPAGIMDLGGSRILFDPEKGEFFSVSRFRQTKVEFPAVDASISTIEVLLIGADPMDKRQKILMRELFKVPATSGGSRAESADNS